RSPRGGRLRCRRLRAGGDPPARNPRPLAGGLRSPSYWWDDGRENGDDAGVFFADWALASTPAGGAVDSPKSLPQGRGYQAERTAVTPEVAGSSPVTRATWDFPAAGFQPDQEAPERQQPDHAEHAIDDRLRQHRQPLDPLRSPDHGEDVDGQAEQQRQDAERD